MYCGLRGWRSATTPKGESASFTALITAPIEPMTPPSDMPLLPVGVLLFGVCREMTSIGGIYTAVASR